MPTETPATEAADLASDLASAAHVQHTWMISLNLRRSFAEGGRLIYHWRLVNDAGLPFNVSRVAFAGRAAVKVSGPAVRKDGSEGHVDRSAQVPWADVPELIRAALTAAAGHHDCPLVRTPVTS